MSETIEEPMILECDDCGHRFLAENGLLVKKIHSDSMWIHSGHYDEPHCPRLHCQGEASRYDTKSGGSE